MRFAVLCALAASGLSCTSAEVRPLPAERPNIVFVFSDDHATAALSCYGSVLNETPHLDRLADEGAIFENAFCTNGICAPSRAVILTGKHSHKNGVLDNGQKFDGGQPTFPKLMQAAGYQTALFGKWHLKSDPTGFDRWEILPGQGHYYGPDLRSPEGQRRVSGYVTEVVTDLALDWLDTERDANRPFLLMLHHKAPHRPWLPGPAHVGDFDDRDMPEPATLFDDYAGRSEAAAVQEMTIARHMFTLYDLKVASGAPPDDVKGPDRWALTREDRMSAEEIAAWNTAYGPRNAAFAEAGLEGDDLVRWKYQRYIKDYLRCIASVDDSMGRVLDALEAQGLADNTIVVYASDQGFFLGEHGWYDKRFMYEPSLRLPFLVRWPAAIPAGTVVDELVQNLDFAPTLLEAARVPIPADMQGDSALALVAPAVDRDAEWRDAIYYEYFERGVHNVAPHYGVRTDRYKLMHFPDFDAWELYDLARDPEEVSNLAGQASHRPIESALKERLAELRVRYEVPDESQP